MDMNQVTVPCSDYDRSVGFYKQMGFLQIVHSPPRYARFETQSGATFSIHSTPTDVVPSEIVIYFEVDDVDRTVAHLESNGLSFETEPVDQDWHWREAYVRDPAGNRLCIYHAGEYRLNPPWRIANDDQ